MKRPTAPIVILTDLDGTLLTHTDYSTAPAKETLKLIQAEHIPLIFNTSKTKPEVIKLRKKLNNYDPFVCENGSALYIPEADDEIRTEILGTEYTGILKVLNQLRKDGYRFRGFNDMPSSEVSALTGLNSDDADMAKSRDATEPLVWQGTEEELASFNDALHDHDLRILKGGRFYHVMGIADKSEGLVYFRDFYQQLWQEAPIMIALGDGENDRAMLEAADYPVVIPGKSKTLELENPNTQTATYEGPQGWNEILHPLITKILKENCSG